MRNTVSTCLLGIGVLLIVIGFITGVVVAGDEYGDFQIVMALYWWLSGLVSGFIFIGMSEIIHLLQKLLDRSGVMNRSFQAAEPLRREENPVTVTAGSPFEGKVGTEQADAETRVKDLTIQLDGERFKGQFWITNSEVRVMKKSMLQSDSEAQLVKVISKSDLASNYERNKEYFVIAFHEGDSMQKLQFKTYNVYDYERILNLLNIKTESS